MSIEPEHFAAELRSWSGVEIEVQRDWKSDREAYLAWKSSLELRDVMAMEISMGKRGIRGFSLPSQRVPVVAVNTAANDAARSFTLWHEIAHLCLDAAASCLHPHPERAPQVERWCDEVASWVLMPRAELQRILVQNQGLDEIDLVLAVARRFRASLRASAIAMGDVDEQYSGLFERIDLEYPIDTDKPAGGGGGGGRPRARLRLAEVGVVGARAISQALAEDRVSELAARRVLKLDGQELVELAAEANT
jgi:Zn-dependent peptidase ImmA (M78 family)